MIYTWGSERFPSKCCLGRNTYLHGPWQRIQKHYGPCRKVERGGARDHRCLEHGKLVSVRPSSVALSVLLSCSLARFLRLLLRRWQLVSSSPATRSRSLSLSRSVSLFSLSLDKSDAGKPSEMMTGRRSAELEAERLCGKQLTL